MLVRLATTASCATNSSTPQAIPRCDITLHTAIQGLILLPNSILKHLYHNTNPPGATMISYFLLLSLKNVRSFCGSISLTTPLAFWASECTVLAYVCVVELSSVVLIGIPEIGAKYDTDRASCTDRVDQIIIFRKKMLSWGNYVYEDEEVEAYLQSECRWHCEWSKTR